MKVEVFVFAGCFAQTPTTRVIWRNTGNSGMCSGELLAMPRHNTGMKWSLTTRAPTPGTGLD